MGRVITPMVNAPHNPRIPMSLKRKLQITFLAVAMAVSLPGLAQTITYDFTGFVSGTSGSFSAVPDGAVISGSYTFDLSAANAVTSTPGSPLFFASLTGGSCCNYPFVSTAIFSTTAQVGGLNYFSAPPSPSEHLYYSYIYPHVALGPSGAMNSLFAGEQTVSPSGSYTGSTFVLDYLNVLPYSMMTGLPVNSGASLSPSEIVSFDSQDQTLSELDYTISSISTVSAVPEPSTYVMMVAGLGILGLLVRRTRAAAIGTHWS